MTLPEGWTSEVRGDRIIIERPSIAFVTVDIERRGFAGGIRHRAPSLATTEYTGRGWRDRLIADAVKWLGAL